jgi:hypothetical protein
MIQHITVSNDTQRGSNMINRDVKRGFEWPSTTRRRKAARQQELISGVFNSSVWLSCTGLLYVALSTLLPEGNWLALIYLILAVSGLTCQAYQMIRSGSGN